MGIDSTRRLTSSLARVNLSRLRALSLGTREPSPRPVSPASPVRVAIFVRRCPMQTALSK